MEQKNENSQFQYTYSAREQAELKRIREKYAEREESKMDRLRRLDRGVAQKAQTAALCFGVIGTLVLGMGMSLAMTELGEVLAFAVHLAMLIGISVGTVGMVLVALAYPIYNCVLKKERARIAPEIIGLTDELLK
jgi:preprotein translocase subunit SecF